MRIANDKIFDDSVTNDTAYSESVDISSMYGYSIHFVATGTSMNGTLVVESSNNKEDWEEVTGTSTAIVGISTTKMINVTETFYKWIRVSITANSNTISTEVYYNGKGV